MSTNEPDPPSPVPSRSARDPAPRRALRVGVLQSGRLVEERLFSQVGEIRVGSDFRCDVVLPPQPGVPRAASLFGEHGGHFTLKLQPGQLAEISAAPGAPVAEVRARPDAPLRHPLDDEGRGRLAFGEVTILFQVVRVSPSRRVPLPPALHDSLMHKLDGWMVGTAVASFAVHAILMVVLRGYDPPRRPDIADIPDRAGRFVYMALPPRAPAPPPPPTTPTPDKGPAPVAASVGHGPRPTAPAAVESAEERNLRIRATVAALLGARGPGGSLHDVLQGGASFAAAEQALAESGTVGVASRSGTPLLLHGDDGPRTTVGIAGLRGPTLHNIEVGARNQGHVPRCPGGVCTPDPPVPPEPGCDPKAVFARMREFRGQLVACYERTRKNDPSAAGKVRLSLTVRQDGLVDEAVVEPETIDAPELVSCIERVARRWVFPELNCKSLSTSQVIVFQPRAD